jgi:cytochrome bd-type quinol oxidase subunit 1
MSDLLFARSQMALSLAFHIIFAAIGIGLPVLHGRVNSARSVATFPPAKNRCLLNI